MPKSGVSTSAQEEIRQKRVAQKKLDIFISFKGLYSVKHDHHQLDGCTYNADTNGYAVKLENGLPRYTEEFDTDIQISIQKEKKKA